MRALIAALTASNDRALRAADPARYFGVTLRMA
jgi:hypothetical protein